jgi:hypothetical protein
MLVSSGAIERGQRKVVNLKTRERKLSRGIKGKKGLKQTGIRQGIGVL